MNKKNWNRQQRSCHGSGIGMMLEGKYMICDELERIRVQLEVFETLFWGFKPVNGLPEDFGWGMGLLLSNLTNDLKKLIDEDEENRKRVKSC